MNPHASDTTTSSTLEPIEPILQPFANPFHLKRTTCDLCRERKVRCDRGKPQCSRCKRTGQPCTYPSAGGEVARFNSELRGLQSRLRQAESKLREKGVSVVVEPVESESTSRFATGPSIPPLSGNAGLEDVALSLDLESWDNAMEFDPLEGLLDHEVPLEPGNLASFPAESQTSIAPEVMEQLYQNYVDVVHKHLPFIDTANFLQKKVHSTTHQCQALTHAVTMAGAGARDTTRHLEQQCYMAARFHLEMAETYMDGSSFLTLETAQALILVVRFEFTNTQAPRALITMTRLMRLIRLLMLDRLDRPDTEGSSPEVDESRRTFWTAFAMHCHETTISEDSDAINMEKIRTYLPWVHDSDARIYLQDAIKHPPSHFSPMAIFVLALVSVVSAEQHNRMTATNVAGTGAPDYNFCLAHERVEKMIGAILDALSGYTQSLLKPDNELQVLALIIAFGARIMVYQAAIMNVQKASFLGPVVGESQKICFSIANAMCDLVLQAEILSPSKVPIYRAMSVFIMRPLALAAQIQISLLQNGSQTYGMVVYYTHREIRHSLEVICQAMEAFQSSTGQYDSLIREARTYLERTEFENRFSAGLGLPR